MPEPIRLVPRTYYQKDCDCLFCQKAKEQQEQLNPKGK